MQAPEGGEEISALWAWLRVSCFSHLLEHQLSQQATLPGLDHGPVGQHRASDSLEAQVDEFADLLVLEQGLAAAKDGNDSGSDSRARHGAKGQQIAGQVSGLIDAMQLWQAFHALISAGRAKLACKLLQIVHEKLSKAGLIR